MFARVGGKSLSKKMINELIPEGETFIEPCVGGGSIYFEMKKNNKYNKYIINDLDKDVFDFYSDMAVYGELMADRDFRPIKDKYWLLVSQSDMEPGPERLYRNIYVSLNSFSGKRTSFCGPTEEAHHLNNNINSGKKWKSDKWKKWLNGTIIRNECFMKIIKEFDTEESFFFIDPPYSANKKSWGYESAAVDYDALNVILMALKGKFILTLDDTPKNRERFNSFTCVPFNVRYTVNGANRSVGSEVMFKNY